MKTTEYYGRLELSPNCTKEDIKRAYKKMALKYHPDKNVQLNTQDCIEKFKSIKEAYEILLDEDKRKLYDLYGPKVLSFMIKSGLTLNFFLKIFNLFWFSTLFLALLTIFFILMASIPYDKSYYAVVWSPIYVMDLLLLYFGYKAYQLTQRTPEDNNENVKSTNKKILGLFIALGFYLCIHIFIHIAIPLIQSSITPISLLLVFIPLFLLEFIHLMINLVRFVEDIKSFGKEETDDLFSRLTGEKQMNQFSIGKLFKLIMDHFWFRTIVIIQDILLYLKLAEMGFFKEFTWWHVFIPAFFLFFSWLVDFLLFYIDGKAIMNKLNPLEGSEQDQLKKGFKAMIILGAILLTILMLFYYSTLIMLVHKLMVVKFYLWWVLIPVFLLLALLICCCSCCCPCFLSIYLQMAAEEENGSVLPVYVSSNRRLKN